ncbi:hypothetical protein LOTGIDRAFT_129447 [Lottia gigantea]|uniref:Sodium/nucleoside cotransporter n=1 Tax=Lottia gigantea TaxID=225164 RepID=V4BB90_LOTGI|nr:hypothetical protein LOTGIDRAFT_129447 [Lottia gigantea]ESO86274.1 hypothetical protein LOTGIDRAFT_129447 [Lottia gigantea]
MKQPRNLSSLAGMVAFLLLCVLASTNVTSINWHCIFWSISVQFILALILLRTDWGISGIEWVAACVESFMENGYKASKFVFVSIYCLISFQSLPLLFLVNSFLAILYHVGLMQILIRGIGKFLSSTLGTTPPESLSVSANMFLGSSQSALVIKPYLNSMSKSELFSMMVGGFASVSGAVFGIFINFGAPAKHLLTACIMSAPASFAISKLLVPESKKNRNKDWEDADLDIQKYKNLIDATGRGALEAVTVCSSVIVNLYVFYALLQFINSLMIWTGERIGVQGLSFQYIISYLLLPIPMLMGVDLVDCRGVAKLIGYKLVGTNGLAFIMLGKLRENKELYLEYSLGANRTWHYKGDDIILDSWNTTLAATYAMCGFSNFASMGIMMGTLFALAPKRQELLVNIILKAMIAGNIACYLTACIAGKVKI